MKKILLLSFAMLMATVTVLANDEDSLVAQMLRYAKFVDSVNSAMKYQTGEIKLPNGVAELSIPAGFKYLDGKQSQYVLSELWGNPPRPDVIGMIFPESGGPMADSSYAFVITYDDMGYVKDADADDINYDEMMSGWHKSEAATNTEREKLGYKPIHVVGWAQKPYYDKTNKILHWAKEIKFGNGEDGNTLNYDIRILGRKGILSLNAVSSMSELPLVKTDIDKVLHIAKFTDGNKYADFNPDVDNVAAWTVGGLVAGKVLAKVGVFAGLLKFLKWIVIGAVAIGAAIFKRIRGKKDEPQMAVEPVTPAPEDNQPNV